MISIDLNEDQISHVVAAQKAADDGVHFDPAPVVKHMSYMDAYKHPFGTQTNTFHSEVWMDKLNSAMQGMGLFQFKIMDQHNKVIYVNWASQVGGGVHFSRLADELSKWSGDAHAGIRKKLRAIGVSGDTFIPVTNDAIGRANFATAGMEDGEKYHLIVSDRKTHHALVMEFVWRNPPERAAFSARQGGPRTELVSLFK